MNKLKFKNLGVKTKDIKDYFDIFKNSSDIESFRTEIAKKYWGAGFRQVMGPLFGKLYVLNKDIKVELGDKLKGFGIPEECFEEYFTQHISHGNLFIHIKYENIRLAKREEFLEKSDELIYKMLKKYLF